MARQLLRVAQDVVDQVGDEDPDGDGQLVQGDEPAPEPGGGHLGGVQRGGHRGHPDPEAHDEPADDQDVGARGERLDEGTGGEQEPRPAGW